MNLKDRVKYFLGLSITLLFHFFITIIINMIFQFETSIVGKILFSGLFDAVLITISLFLGMYFINKIMIETASSQDENEINQLSKSISLEEQENPIIKKFKAGFNITEIKSQIIATLILICLIYLPIDLISYLIPGVFEYQSSMLLSVSVGQYLSFSSLSTMMIVALIYHFFVAFREELYFRNYLLSMGKSLVKENTAFVYSAFLFSIAHFSYIFSPSSSEFSIGFPFLWGLNSLIIGLVSAYYYLEKGKIYPIIIAHWINNFISSTATRFYLDGKTISFSFLRLYLPFFIIGIILLLAFWKKITYNVKNLMVKLKGYLVDCSDYGEEDSASNLPSSYEIKKRFIDTELSNKISNNERNRKKKSKVSKWEEHLKEKSASNPNFDENQVSLPVNKGSKFNERETNGQKSKKKVSKKERQKENKKKRKSISIKAIYPYILIDLAMMLVLWIFQTFLLLNFSL